MPTAMSQISESVIEVCQGAGMAFKKQGGELYSKCPFHADGGRPNFRVNIEKNSWFCDVCGIGGGVGEFIARKDGRDKKEVFKELVQKETPAYRTAEKGEIAAVYDYVDRIGNLVFQVCRMMPKSFRQRHPDGRGGWIWNMEGIERVLYKLPHILNPKNRFVWIVEGEKDVHTLNEIGMAATTNAGGAGKWSDAYSECLKGKEVLICGDNDEPGRKHMAKVIESLEPFAASIRRIDLPAQFKDVSDFAASFNGKDKFIEAITALIDVAQVMLPGGTLPIKSMAELEQEYQAHVKNSRERLVTLANWIPSLGCIRPLVAGELVSVVGDTGTAKTYVLQHIAFHCRVPTLLFELELPGALTFERFVGIAQKASGESVFNKYDAGETMTYSDLSHVYTCTKSRLSPQEIESIILKSELKMGVRPTLVLVDYIQLVQGSGKSRYEKMSDVAEQLKIVAKNTGCVVVMASQVSRDKTSPEITLHDAKDSGSIENSSGVVLGIWRDDKRSNVLNLKVLKNTKGKPSQIIKCQIQGDTMRIAELIESKIDSDDIPIRNYD